MKRIVVSSLGVSLSLSAQETRRDVVHTSPNPADDAKPNSDRVPEVYALKAACSASLCRGSSSTQIFWPAWRG
jgi:hypothetical protein